MGRPIAFQEDESRVGASHAAEYFAVLRHLALNLPRHERTAEIGIKGKRVKCGWGESQVLKVQAR